MSTDYLTVVKCISDLYRCKFLVENCFNYKVKCTTVDDIHRVLYLICNKFSTGYIKHDKIF